MFWKSSPNKNAAASQQQCAPSSIGMIEKDREPRPEIDLKGDVTLEDMIKVVNSYHQSSVIHSIAQLEHVINSNQKVQDWEVRMVKKTLEKFLAKHDSPLAKALK